MGDRVRGVCARIRREIKDCARIRREIKDMGSLPGSVGRSRTVPGSVGRLRTWGLCQDPSEDGEGLGYVAGSVGAGWAPPTFTPAGTSSPSLSSPFPPPSSSHFSPAPLPVIPSPSSPSPALSLISLLTLTPVLTLIPVRILNPVLAPCSPSSPSGTLPGGRCAPPVRRCISRHPSLGTPCTPPITTQGEDVILVPRVVIRRVILLLAGLGSLCSP